MVKLPTKYEIFSYWKNWLFKNEKILDYDIQCCFACGDYKWRVNVSKHVKPLLYNSPLTMNDVEKLWNNLRGVEIHHILPKQFNGSDSVENLFILCRNCHNKAPIASFFGEDNSLFLKWAKNQSFIKNLKDEINENLNWIVDNQEEREDFISWMNFQFMKFNFNIKEMFDNWGTKPGIHFTGKMLIIPFSSIFTIYYRQWKLTE